MIVYPNVKLNLGLNILSRRPDGFHDIETLFVPFNGIYDILEIVPAQSFEINISECDWDPMQDLTVKAYQMLKEDFNLPPVSISLKKQAPVGAGLGGGSADAAFTLMALNELCSLGLSRNQLVEYASRLGSDCAFFIYNDCMIGEGRGEILSPFHIDLSDYYIDVRVPDEISVSTKEAYAGVVPAIPEKSLRSVLSQPVETWKDDLKNDFEATVFKKYPYLKKMKKELYEEGAVYASMSGSGSSIFGLFKK